MLKHFAETWPRRFAVSWIKRRHKPGLNNGVALRKTALHFEVKFIPMLHVMMCRCSAIKAEGLGSTATRSTATGNGQTEASVVKEVLTC